MVDDEVPFTSEVCAWAYESVDRRGNEGSRAKCQVDDAYYAKGRLLYDTGRHAIAQDARRSNASGRVYLFFRDRNAGGVLGEVFARLEDHETADTRRTYDRRRVGRLFFRDLIEFVWAA